MKTTSRTPKLNAAQRQASRARRRLLVEQLEDRKLLAVIAGESFESAGFSGGSGWIDGSRQVTGDAGRGARPVRTALAG